jgi:hypothetical protein
MKKTPTLLAILLPLILPVTALAGTGQFVDAQVNNVAGLTFEVEKCANGNVPYVGVNGQDFGGGVVLGGPDIIDYKIPFSGAVLNIKIGPCTSSDSISFKLNGTMFTPAQAAAATQAVNAGAPLAAPTSSPPLIAPTSSPPIIAPTSSPPIIAPTSSLGDPNEIDTVQDVLNVIDKLTNWIFTIFIAAAVIMVMMAAFVYLKSEGGEDTAKAHKMLLYCAVAIAVAILARGVVNVVKLIVKP